MTDSALALSHRPSWPRAVPFYYGWVNVIVASLAMTATLPGRTHGLGLVTEPLLADLGVDRLLRGSIWWPRRRGRLLHSGRLAH